MAIYFSEYCIFHLVERDLGVREMKRTENDFTCPEYIKVKHKKMADGHFFTSDDIGINIFDEDSLIAFNQIEPSIKHLVKLQYGIDVEVRLADSYGDF